MKTTDFISLLITPPRINGAYIASLARALESADSNSFANPQWIMYRIPHDKNASLDAIHENNSKQTCKTTDIKSLLYDFTHTLAPFGKRLMLNPKSEKQICSLLSLPFGGIHLKSYMLDSIPRIKTHIKSHSRHDSPRNHTRAITESTRDSILLGYSAHSLDEVERALELGADYCTLSPIFPTPHKSTPLGGLTYLDSIPVALRPFIIALGGITAEAIPAIRSMGFLGFGAIGYFETALLAKKSYR